MEELYSKKLKCPCCDNNFTSSKVKSSKLRVEKRDSDFLVYYKGENPIKYNVFVCPYCGYSAQETNFDSLHHNKREIIYRYVTSKWQKRDYSGVRSIEDAIECNKLALFCGELIGLKKIELGNICLRLAWLYRMLERDEEKRFLQNALSLFEEVYFNEGLAGSTMDEITLGYLIGDIYRRMGNNNVAISWFAKVVANPLIKTNPRIESLTREQWSLAKESEKNEWKTVDN